MSSLEIHSEGQTLISGQSAYGVTLGRECLEMNVTLKVTVKMILLNIIMSAACRFSCFEVAEFWKLQLTWHVPASSEHQNHVKRSSTGQLETPENLKEKDSLSFSVGR